MLKVIDNKTGLEIKDNILTSFRGEKARLIMPTRAKTDCKSGKVVVEWMGGIPFAGEYYDKVFDVTVVDIK